MNKSIFAIFIFALVAVVSGCKKDEVVDTYWKDKNYAFLDSLATVYSMQKSGAVQVEDGDSLYRLIPLYDANYPIYYKKLGVKEGYVGVGEPAKFTQTATVYYKGKLIDGTVFDSTFSGEFPDKELDRTYSFLVSGTQGSSSGVIYGWTEIAQIMRPADKKNPETHKGDFFRVYIPSEMAYGTDGSGSIPGYSVLEFDINMVEVE